MTGAMKKEYGKPEIKVIQIRPAAIVCNSLFGIYNDPADEEFEAW